MADLLRRIYCHGLVILIVGGLWLFAAKQAETERLDFTVMYPNANSIRNVSVNSNSNDTLGDSPAVGPFTDVLVFVPSTRSTKM